MTGVKISPTPVRKQFAKPNPMGDCYRSDKNYRGPHYDFCVSEDLNWKNIPHAPSVQYFKAGTDAWFTLGWNVYGINAIKLDVAVSSQIKECPTKGQGSGFNIPVNGNDNYEFDIRDWKSGLYKFELFVTQKDGVTRGHNELFLCLV